MVLGFCSVVFGWDILDKLYSTDVEFGGDDCQYPDLLAKVDLSSYRRIPWEHNIPFFLLYLVHPTTNQPLYCCPRTCLRQVVDDFKEIGYTALSGVEFEFFCFQGKIRLIGYLSVNVQSSTT
jgi:glutamine synthetase